MKMRTIGLTSMALAAVAVIAAWNVVSPAPAHAGGVPGSGDAEAKPHYPTGGNSNPVARS